MSSWNYRVVLHRSSRPEDNYYAIHEAYYEDNKKKPQSISVNPIEVGSENIEGLKWQLEEMKKAFDRPVLDQETLKEVK